MASANDVFCLLSNPGRDVKRDDVTFLPPEFGPGDTDVICQRGKDSFEHAGNRRFRVLIEDHLDMYIKATSRQEKSQLLSKVYDQIRRSAKGHSIGFLRKDLLTQRWYSVDEKEAREKVGQAFRDAMKGVVRAKQSSKAKADKITSSTKTMKKKNQCEQASVVFEEEHIINNNTLNRKIDTTSRLRNSNLFSNQGSLRLGEHSMSEGAATPLLTDKMEDMERDRHGVMLNNMLESSILPLHAGNDEKRARPLLDSGVRDTKSFLSWETPHLSALYGTIITPGQVAVHDQVTPSDLMLRMSASNPTTHSTAALSMLLQRNSSSLEQARQYLMGVPCWDLEPTPVRVPQGTATSSAMDPRTAALASLLFQEGSLSLPSPQGS